MAVLPILSLVLSLRSSLSIGCDTVVELNGRILEKPKSYVGACQMLSELSGKSHNVFSGVVLICKRLRCVVM